MSSCGPEARFQKATASVLVVLGLGCAARAASPSPSPARPTGSSVPSPVAEAAEVAPSPKKGPAGLPGQGAVDDVDRRRGILWRFHAGAPLDGGAGVGRGRVYVGTVDGYLHALTAGGAFRWSYTVKGGIIGAPRVDRDGRVYVATTAHSIYAIHPDGTRWWTFQSPAAIVTPLASARDGSMVFGGSDHHIWLVSSRAGARWRADVGTRIASGPVVAAAGHPAVAVTGDGTVSWVQGAWSRWDVHLDGVPSGEPVIGRDGVVYVVVGGTLHALGDKGRKLWAWPGTERVARGAGDTLIAMGAGRFSVLGPDGKVVRQHDWNVHASAQPAVLADRVFVSADDGTLVVMGESGIIGRVPVARAALHQPAIIAGTVVVAAGDGTVVGVRSSGWVP